MKTLTTDCAVIGSGPAGLAAAVRARELGVKDLIVFERDVRPGGILKQCIHTGFGIEVFKEELTGPEFANRYIKKAEAAGVDIELDTTVLSLDKNRTLLAAGPRGGMREFRCKTVILAMGCRERPRGALDIPGTRPAGIFTAGHAQRLVNIEGYMPGQSVVILGSGDIGMIMARRMTLEGAEVKAVIEKLPYAGGLIRNEVQCLHDFGIPFLPAHTVTEVIGERRVEGVIAAQADPEGMPVEGTEKHFECDTLLLSVGLIPENELSKGTGLDMDDRTSGPVVDHRLESTVEGIFACGNVLHVNDVADTVSMEGEMAAEAACDKLKGSKPKAARKIAVEPSDGIGQVVPHFIDGRSDAVLQLRVKEPMDKVKIRLGNNFEKTISYARPGEMIRLKVPAKKLALPDDSVRSLDLWCEPVRKNGTDD